MSYEWLDAFRAEQVHVLVVHCPVESLSVLRLNPTYDFGMTKGKPKR